MTTHRTTRAVELAQLGRELADRLGRAEPVGLSMSRVGTGPAEITAPADVPADVLAAVVAAHTPADRVDPDVALVDGLRAATSWEAVRDVIAADVERRGRQGRTRPPGVG